MVIIKIIIIIIKKILIKIINIVINTICEAQRQTTEASRKQVRLGVVLSGFGGLGGFGW